MVSLAQLQDQVFDREGFRVEFAPLDPKTKRFPDYRFPVMGTNKWRISEWKAERLGAYVTLMRSVTVFRGDGSPVKSDMRLGNLRDSYFEAEYGGSNAVTPPAPKGASSVVVPLRKRAKT